MRAEEQSQWPLIEIFSRTFSQGMNLDRFDRLAPMLYHGGRGRGGREGRPMTDREPEREYEDEQQEYFTEPLT